MQANCNKTYKIVHVQLVMNSPIFKMYDKQVNIPILIAHHKSAVVHNSHSLANCYIMVLQYAQETIS